MHLMTTTVNIADKCLEDLTPDTIRKFHFIFKG